jgi:ADP-ribosylglycohydrolase
MTEALGAVEAAIRNPEDAAALESLGEGWVSEEAVVMAMTAVLRHPSDFAAAMRCAVNHGGDSDTVGCIAGAIAGAGLGEGAIPPEWLAHLTGADTIRSAADRLTAARERMR